MCINYFSILKSISSSYCFFLKFFASIIKVSKKSSAKNYEDNKERLENKLVKDIKVYIKKKKKNNHNMIMKNTKFSQEMKSKRFLCLN